MLPGPSVAGLAGIATVVGPYLYSFGGALGVLDRPSFLPQPWTLITGCLCVALGGLALTPRHIWDQVVLTAGVAVVIASVSPALTQNPGLALAVLLLGSALVFAAWESDLPFPLRTRSVIPTHSDLAGTAARSAAATAAAAELALVLFFDASGEFYQALGLGLAAAFVLRWCFYAWREQTKRTVSIVLACAGAFALYWTGSPTLAHLLVCGIVLVAIPSVTDSGIARNFAEAILQHPAGPVVTSFFLLCAFGSLMLLAPAASTVKAGLSSIDAVFTAVSAVCVTGLIVLDTPNDFTLTGQAIILLLIQLGALGIMSYSAAIIIALGQRLRLRDESLLASSLNAKDRGLLRPVLTRLIRFTFISEAIGAALLAILFHRHGDAPWQATWRGLFTAISAFCNAGFAIQSDSLIPYQREPLILHVVGILIILGSLSPAAALAIPRILRRKERSAQAHLILMVTGILLAANFVLIAAFEWNGALSGLSIADRLHNAWLQSVTLRTAGFNSVAFDSLRPATLLIMMTSMFVGGSPGGTAGGIKTTTAAVMIFSVIAAIRGNKEVSVYGRRISTMTIDRAAAITTLGAITLGLTVLFLFLTQSILPASAVFEAVSALATVGLSVGATAQLDSIGKLIIVFAMFAGRVGPLSMFAFLSSRQARDSVQHPVEAIDVG